MVIVLLFAGAGQGYAQLTDGTTGLLHMPSAEMQRDGTFIVGGNYLNYRNVPYASRGYRYNSFNYFINITFLKRLEISYICTLNKGVPNSGYWPKVTWGKFRNQDRHFAARVLLVWEDQWTKYMPAIVVGVSDPTTGGGGGKSLADMDVAGDGNGWFNRWYVAATKHINTRYGEFGIHAAYLYNQRVVNHLNGPAFGVSYRPAASKNCELIAEYDAKTVNVGAIISLWNDHFNVLVELKQCRHLSAGLVYKVNLLGGNKWKSKFIE